MNTVRKKENSLVMRLAWPCILENLSATMVSLVDTAMVGSLGMVATAAVGVCASPTWLLNGLVQSLGVGGTALVARYCGAKEMDEAEHVTQQVFRVALLMAVAVMALMFFGAPIIPLLMQAKPEVVPEATAYLRIISGCYLFHYTGMALGALLRGAGDTKTPMKCGLMANLLNIVLNFFLIYSSRNISLFGYQIYVYGAGMGVRGAAVASSIAMGVAGLYLIVHMLRKGSVLHIALKWKQRFDRAILSRVVRIGTPAALERAAINVGQMVFAAMISSIGTAELAAYHITINVEGIGYMPAYGFAAAATALVGQRLGAKKPEEAARLGNRAIYLSLALLTLSGVAMYLASGFLASCFSPDPNVVAITTVFIAIVAVEQPFNAFSIVTAGALRGAGDTVKPFLYGMLTMWGIRIFGAWLMGIVLGWGVYAIFWAMVADLGVRSILLQARFMRGKWKNAKV